MNYGTYQNPKDAVRKFVYDELIGAALAIDPPDSLNIPQQFTNFLVGANFNRLLAEEEAEKQSDLVRRRLDDARDQWLGIGLPAPIAYADNDDVLLTWKHARYREITGHEPLSTEFVETHEWLTSLKQREFLLPCAAFLKIIGCDSIFITDGPRDEGIDCIGKIANGPLRSILIFVQSKTSEAVKRLSKEVLYQEYGKYATLPTTDKYREYQRALNVEESRDGSARIYFVMSNGEFTKEAQVVAGRLGVLLRSVRQLAYFLSIHSTPQQLKRLQSEITMPRGPDLSANFASEIHLTAPENTP